MPLRVNRRSLILAPALAAAAQGPSDKRPIVISSDNGLLCCENARTLIERGQDTLDAVVAGVGIVENDPKDTSVGYGGLPNEEGIVELDACVMHGPTRRAGSVASLRNIKNPAKVAKLVMEMTDHVMLVGEGALRFAKTMGIKEEDLLTEQSRLAWLVWKQSMRDGQGRNNWTDGLDAPLKKPSAALRQLFPHADEQMLAWAQHMAKYPTTGTINCLALNAKGEMSGCTTTSGLAWKIPGRVGDSPIIGAGLYVDQEVGAGGSTGRGEENIRVCGAHTVVEAMRQGKSPNEACLEALRRISRNYDNDLTRLKQFDITFYALRKDGAYGSAGLFAGQRFAVNDGGASRLMNCVSLYQKK
jgi:N4-(beta-N-acetylglucosaminyl)-L-asparaginase